MIDRERLLNRTAENLLLSAQVSLKDATPEQLHNALGGALMAEIAENWALSRQRRARGRQAFYLSAEYLIGRLVFNNLFCVRVLDDVRDMLKARGASLEALEDIEDDAFGNGGLGRLAACYLDSAATHVVPLTGYGLRYRFGLFKQSFEHFRQVEAPDDWSRFGDPWSVRRDDLSVIVHFKDHAVRAVPYDMPVIGYQTENIGTLRLFQTESLCELDFEAFNDQRYADACRDKNRAEDIVKLLYPNDSTDEGKMMRIKQQYVLSSAAMQDILRAFKASDVGDVTRFPLYCAMQLNDTHPVMAIPELIRLLEADGLSFDQAFEMAARCFNYTNHTVMQEALEVWDEALLENTVPQLLPILHRIDERLRAQAPELFICQDGRVHMANLAVYAASHVNGVARLHSQLLKTTVFSGFYARFPERFVNVTNGVTQRRWLGLCNPELTALLAERLNDNFLTELSDLSRLRSRMDDSLCEQFLAVKLEKKRQLAQIVRQDTGVEIDPEWMFDVQVKRLHEYKRQLLNAFGILALYFQMKDGALTDYTPTVFLFAGKSAPGYARAKAIIRYINQIAALINGDPEVNDRLRVVFLPNYNCSLAEKIIPAADVSEQISTAGTEASGTGNMKLMLNGAITLGTMDGANIEIVEQAGEDQNVIFGARVEELDAIRKTYKPRGFYRRDPLLRRVVDTLKNGAFEDEDGALLELYDALLKGASWHQPDHYFLLKDFRPYLEAKLRVAELYKDRLAFARMALCNVTGAGAFSADRAVIEYAEKIWHV